MMSSSSFQLITSSPSPLSSPSSSLLQLFDVEGRGCIKKEEVLQAFRMCESNGSQMMMERRGGRMGIVGSGCEGGDDDRDVGGGAGLSPPLFVHPSSPPLIDYKGLVRELGEKFEHPPPSSPSSIIISPHSFISGS